MASLGRRIAQRGRPFPTPSPAGRGRGGASVWTAVRGSLGSPRCSRRRLWKRDPPLGVRRASHLLPLAIFANQDHGPSAGAGLVTCTELRGASGAGEGRTGAGARGVGVEGLRGSAEGDHGFVGVGRYRLWRHPRSSPLPRLPDPGLLRPRRTDCRRSRRRRCRGRRAPRRTAALSFAARVAEAGKRGRGVRRGARGGRPGTAMTPGGPDPPTRGGPRPRPGERGPPARFSRVSKASRLLSLLCGHRRLQVPKGRL